ncbi:MAG TPA: serine hydrolase domain-containing protein [Opitutaceae bacterium]|nr:serine hydrolase domain-containing protein [Opitutaceae bacterium]
MFSRSRDGPPCIMLVALALVPAFNVLIAGEPHAEIDAMMRDLHARDLFHGAIIVADAGAVVYEASFGIANREEAVTFTLDTPNDTGSIAKPLTALIVWKLHADGRLSVDDPVHKHLPTFPYPAITVRHLLAHSSGLPNYDWFEKAWPAGTVWTNERFLTTLASEQPPLEFEPGSQFNYCNTAYDIAALVAAAAAGEPFESLARDWILAPLQMETAFIRPAMFADWKDTRTRGYRLKDDVWEDHDAFDNEGMVGGGNFYLSARDLHRWNMSFLESPLLQAATLAEGMKPATIGGISSELNWLSWNQADGGNKAWYSGEHNAFSTRVHRDHAARRSIVFTCNNTPPQWLLPALIRAITAVLDGASPEPLVPPEIRQVPRSERDAIAGHYPLRDGALAIENTSGTLHVTPEGGVRYRAFAIGGGIFYVPGLELWFWFAPDLELVASRVTGIEKAKRHR